MKKGSNIFVAAIVLSVCLLCMSSVGATDHGFFDRGKQLPSGLVQEDSGARLVDLPAGVREKIAQHLRRVKYEVSRCEKELPSGKTSTYRAFNRNENLSAYFTEQGVHLLPNGKGEPAWHLEMTLSGYGYEGAMEPAQSVRSDAIKTSGHRIEYQRGALTEWYVNDERGFEQGVTLNEPPDGQGAGPLVVEWDVSGSLSPQLEQQGDVIAFCNKGGTPILHYSGLKAWDATGRSLPAELTVQSGGPKDAIPRIAYVVDDSSASYPVMIDPVFAQIRKLRPAGLPADLGQLKNELVGESVAISGDTVVVGAGGDDYNGTDTGSAYIFYRDQGGVYYWDQASKITASDGGARDRFGSSVAISGDTVVVGAYGAGAAYIFYRDQGGPDNWGEVRKITASDGATGDNFGYSLSISGDTVVVGGHAEGAYIFYRDQGGADNWGEVQKITAWDGEAGDNFGGSVAISGDTVVVGASGDDPSGSAYIHYRDWGGDDNWGEARKIWPSDGEAGDRFGRSVSISDYTVVVGAYQEDDNGINSGAAYIFDRDQGGADNWGEVQKITASDGAGGDNFGYSLSISGDTVVVGAILADAKWPPIDSGAAYIFDRDQGGSDNWGEVRKITASDGAWGDNFGHSVSISGDTVVVGGHAEGAYIFDRDQGGADNWGEVQKITASDGASGDKFGYSLSISGDTVVVGAYGDDDNGTDSGSAYIFHVADADGDGIYNIIDERPLDYSNYFQDRFVRYPIGTTSGSITDRGDQTLIMTEEPNPAGVRIRAVSSVGATPATVTSCGAFWSISVDGIDDIIATWICPWLPRPSATVQVREGPVEILLLEEGILVTVPTDATVTITEVAHRTFEIENLPETTATDPIVVEFQGEVIGLYPGESITITITPTGIYIEIRPMDATTGTHPVTIIFSEVIQAGMTTLTTSSDGPTPPSGFKLGEPPTYYEVETTATYSGQITVCIDYTGISFVGNEEDLRLYHYEGGVPIDVTVLPVDTANKIICGTVTSTSPFAIFEPAIEATIIIDSCDSGVSNHVFEDGRTMADLIAECADGAKNHGKFVSCVSHLTNDWKKEGLISGREKGAIQSCAAQADIP